MKLNRDRVLVHDAPDISELPFADAQRVIEGEFLQSWDDLERYYYAFQHNPLVRHLVLQLRSKGYDRTLRAASQHSVLVLARSRRRGVSPMEPHLKFIFQKESVDVTAVDMFGEKTLAFTEVELIPRMESMLKELESMAIQ